jgi:hypothetical protein
MLALQYSIHLPHDTEDRVIEDRVAQRAPVFEDLDGMVHKAFLYNRSDKLYAPFYVWENLAGARDFLFDELFQGFVNQFRRPRTRSWIVLHQSHGLLKSPPSFARCESDLVPSEKSLEEVIASEKANHDEKLKQENLYYHMTALNPDRWEIMEYSLWKDPASAPPAEADCVQDFDVLHLNEPQAH